MTENVTEKAELPPINTINEFAISAGQNLSNHSTALIGRGRFVRQGTPEVPTFRTKQSAYRFAAYLVLMADVHLPDENDGEHHDATFDEIYDAISNA